MRLPRRTPFAAGKQQELFALYRHLYPHSTLSQPHQAHDDGVQLAPPTAPDPSRALSTVQLWMNRRSCPYAVESTASLVQATILDQHMQDLAASLSLASLSSSSFPSSSASAAGPNPAAHSAAALPGFGASAPPLERMGGGAELGIRMNYTMAITRFVNSIVDSYQTGNFAQSIAAIAARIGLPHWFVELRHAGTHEELPSIDVCREGARAALDWLHRNFWIPSLFTAQSLAETPAPVASTSTIVHVQAEPTEADRIKERTEALDQLATLLRDYRKLGKAIARDQSLAGRQRAEVYKIFRGVLNWTNNRMMAEGEAPKLIASRMGRKRTREEMEEEGSGGGWAEDSSGFDRELVKAAHRDLVHELMKPSGLISMSKSKRTRSSAVGDDIQLPRELKDTWAPLVTYLRDNLGLGFFSTLIEELIGSLAYTPPPEAAVSDAELASRTETENEDWKTKAWKQPSYKKTAEAWLRHLIVDDDRLMVEEVDGEDGGMAKTLELSVVEQCLRLPSAGTTSLLSFLCTTNTTLGKHFGDLVAMLESPLGIELSELASRSTSGPTLQDEEANTEARADPAARPAASGDTSSSLSAAAEAPATATSTDKAAIPVPHHESHVSGDSQTLRGTQTGYEAELTEMEDRRERYRLSMARAEEAAAVKAESQRSEETKRELNNGGETAGAATDAAAAEVEWPAGWTVVDQGWRPTPIGCLEGKVPVLTFADVQVA